MENIKEQKKALRRAYKARGEALTMQYRKEADRAIREKILRDARWQRARGVFLYVSVGAEPDTRALIDAALREGKRVYVPRCLPERMMEAVRIQSLAELRPGAFGIPEPPADAEAALPGVLDHAIVPCVTATESGARLGHGAGYYDRFLRRHACPAVCLCYRALLADTLPTEAHDVAMDAVVCD